MSTEHLEWLQLSSPQETITTEAKPPQTTGQSPCPTCGWPLATTSQPCPHCGYTAEHDHSILTELNLVLAPRRVEINPAPASWFDGSPPDIDGQILTRYHWKQAQNTKYIIYIGSSWLWRKCVIVANPQGRVIHWQKMGLLNRLFG